MASKITFEKTERKGRKLLASVEDDLAECGGHLDNNYIPNSGCVSFSSIWTCTLQL